MKIQGKCLKNQKRRSQRESSKSWDKKWERRVKRSSTIWKTTTKKLRQKNSLFSDQFFCLFKKRQSLWQALFFSVCFPTAGIWKEKKASQKGECEKNQRKAIVKKDKDWNSFVILKVSSLLSGLFLTELVSYGLWLYLLGFSGGSAGSKVNVNGFSSLRFALFRNWL